MKHYVVQKYAVLSETEYESHKIAFGLPVW